jgi:hypothetical protein
MSRPSTPIQDVLKERDSHYGEFKFLAAGIQMLKLTMRNGKTWYRLEYDQKEALEMIAVKIARILNGDPNYIDSWLDIAGYAQLVVNRLEQDAAQAQSDSEDK